MNKKLYYTICSSVIGAFLVVWIITFSIFAIKNNAMQNNTENLNTSSTNDSISFTKNSSAEKNLVDEHYLIVCEGQNLIVYHISQSGVKTFYDKLDIDATQLRKTDRDAFVKGVTVKDKIDLAHIIEDYTS